MENGVLGGVGGKGRGSGERGGGEKEDEAARPAAERRFFATPSRANPRTSREPSRTVKSTAPHTSAGGSARRSSRQPRLTAAHRARDAGGSMANTRAARSCGSLRISSVGGSSRDRRRDGPPSPAGPIASRHVAISRAVVRLDPRARRRASRAVHARTSRSGPERRQHLSTGAFSTERGIPRFSSVLITRERLTWWSFFGKLWKLNAHCVFL